MNRVTVATISVLLAPVSSGFGSWMIFQASILIESKVSNAINVAKTSIGLFFFVLGFPLLFSSLGAFASRNNLQAERWFRWLGRLKPNFEINQEKPIHLYKYRSYAMTILFVTFLLAILLIPGIGEDRQYPLTQFYGFLGSLWYFYAFAVGIAGFVLIYSRRSGGYVLSLLLGLIAIGTNLTDILGLQPPSAPTLRTSILELATLPLSFLLAYLSVKALRP